MLKTLRVAAALAFSGPVFGGAAAAPAFAAPAAGSTVSTAEALRDRAEQGDHQAFALLESLTTEIGPRPAGSEAERRAADWAVVRLKALGFENVHKEPFKITAWRRGEERAEIVSPFPQRLLVTALGNSVATPTGGLDGEAVVFRSYQALLDSAPGSLKGKIAIVTQAMPVGGYAHYFQIRSQGPVEAARRGAIAYLLRSLGTDGRRVPHTGAILYPDAWPGADAPPRIPAAALSAVDAEQLDRIASRGAPIRLHLLLTPESLPGQTTETVVGELRGRDLPDEVVLIGGHLDSWDLGTGALDDGAGVAITLAAAREIAELPQRPRRTIRVVLFGAEEIGQSNKAYAARHGAAEQAAISIATECDLGADHIYGIELPAGASNSEFGRNLARVVQSLGVYVSADPATDGGGDLDNLKGVPLANLQQDATRYFEFHHTAEDTLDKIDRRALNQNVATWAAFTYLAAETQANFRDAAKSPSR